MRVLRRLNLPDGATGEGRQAIAGFGVVVDVETNGLDPATDTVIELAARRFAYDEDFVISRLDRPYVWRQDPGRPLPPEITRITGIGDADLAGRRIDVDEAVRVVGSATIRIAHNARFDRPFVERTLPAVAGLSWACSIEDVDWAGHGYESVKLGWILMRQGWFHDAHRAEADVDATIRILTAELAPGSTVLRTLMTRAGQPSWTVHALGAPFERKDRLRTRGYRWDPSRRAWWREVRDREGEEAWLDEAVYTGSYRRGAPCWERTDWTSRYG